MRSTMLLCLAAATSAFLVPAPARPRVQLRMSEEESAEVDWKGAEGWSSQFADPCLRSIIGGDRVSRSSLFTREKLEGEMWSVPPHTEDWDSVLNYYNLINFL